MRQRMVAVHERFRGDARRSQGRRRDPINVLNRQRQRLLTQDVLAGLERPHRPLNVQTVGQPDVDDVDLGSESIACTMRTRAGLSTRWRKPGRDARAAGDGGQLAPCRAADGGDELPMIRAVLAGPNAGAAWLVDPYHVVGDRRESLEDQPAVSRHDQPRIEGHLLVVPVDESQPRLGVGLEQDQHIGGIDAACGGRAASTGRETAAGGIPSRPAPAARSFPSAATP